MENDFYQNADHTQVNTDETGDGHTENLYAGMRTEEYMQAMAARASQANQGQYRYYQGYQESPEPKKPKVKKTKIKKQRKKSGSSFWKKGVAIVVSATVFGGVAGGAFNLVAGDKIRELNRVAQQMTEETEVVETVAQTATTEALGLTQTSSAGVGMDVSSIAENVMPSVVAINISAIIEQQSFFGYTQQYEAEGSGSGIIIGENDSELLIVTNNHVVSDATTVNVCFVDGESYEAKVKGTDSDNDLAIIVVDLDDISESTMSKLKIATIGDSDAVKVGEQVVAIGNALGYGQSVTTGIVSAKDRTNSTNETPLIQTDAAINPGNSGGALLNMKGEVIGINSSKYSDTTVEGMGYAIPITAVHDILDNLMNRETREKVDEDERGFLGISCGTITSDISEAYGIPVGVLVSEVQDNGGAKEAGIRKNYIITKIDGLSVSSAEELTEKLSYYKAGETIPVTFQYLKDDSYVEETVNVTLGENPNHN
ncbi:MAG: S1C family serine protease [Wujia sp.]